MANINYRAMPVDDLIKEIGIQLRAAIKKRSNLGEFADQAGVTKRTLSRVVKGESVSWESILRILRALDRWDVIAALATPPDETPLEKLYSKKAKVTPSVTQKNRVSEPPFVQHLAKPFLKKTKQGGE